MKSFRNFDESNVARYKKQIDRQKKRLDKMDNDNPQDARQKEAQRDRIEKIRDRKDKLTGHPKESVQESLFSVLTRLAARKKSKRQIEAEKKIEKLPLRTVEKIYKKNEGDARRVLGPSDYALWKAAADRLGESVNDKDVSLDSLNTVKYPALDNEYSRRNAKKRKRADVEHEQVEVQEATSSHTTVLAKQDRGDYFLIDYPPQKRHNPTYMRKVMDDRAKELGISNYQGIAQWRGKGKEGLDSYIKEIKQKIEYGNNHFKKEYEELLKARQILKKNKLIEAVIGGRQKIYTPKEVSKMTSGKGKENNAEFPSFDMITPERAKKLSMNPNREVKHKIAEEETGYGNLKKKDKYKNRVTATTAGDATFEYFDIDDETIDEAITVAQRRRMARSLRRNKAKLKMGKRRQSRKIASRDRLQGRSKAAAKRSLVKKFTGGKSKSELSPARKAEVEKRLKNMSGRVDRISKKLLPSVRRADRSRKR